MAITDLALQALGIPLWAVAILLIWSVIWMGFAMWKSARQNQPIWFIVFLIVHTFGILEILYIFIFSKMGSSHSRKK